MSALVSGPEWGKQSYQSPITPFAHCVYRPREGRSLRVNLGAASWEPDPKSQTVDSALATWSLRS